MKSPVTQFIKIQLFSSPLEGILFLIEHILGITLMFKCGFHPIIVCSVAFVLILIWGMFISNFKDKVCPHCYGELEVTDENLNILITQKKFEKKCKECGKEFSSTAHYLD
jgi:hypothetical protein